MRWDLPHCIIQLLGTEPCMYAHTYFKINVVMPSKINFLRAKAELSFLIKKVSLIKEWDYSLLEEKCLYHILCIFGIHRLIWSITRWNSTDWVMKKRSIETIKESQKDLLIDELTFSIAKNWIFLYRSHQHVHIKGSNDGATSIHDQLYSYLLKWSKHVLNIYKHLKALLN